MSDADESSSDESAAEHTDVTSGKRGIHAIPPPTQCSEDVAAWNPPPPVAMSWTHHSTESIHGDPMFWSRELAEEEQRYPDPDPTRNREVLEPGDPGSLVAAGGVDVSRELETQLAGAMTVQLSTSDGKQMQTTLTNLDGGIINIGETNTNEIHIDEIHVHDHVKKQINHITKNYYGTASSTDAEDVTPCSSEDKAVYKELVADPQFQGLLEALDTKGRVFLSAPPGPQRSAFVCALRRHFNEHGHTVYYYLSVKDWGKKKAGSDKSRQVVLIDCAFGVARLDREQLNCFYKYKMYRFKSNSIKIVFLVYPHVIAELQQRDRINQHPVLDTVHVVTLIQQSPLNFDEYYNFFMCMLRDKDHGEAMASLFILTMLHSCKTNTKEKCFKALKHFGFKKYSQAKLNEYTTLFNDFLLSDGDFKDKVLYDAAFVSLSSTYLTAQIMLKGNKERIDLDGLEEQPYLALRLLSDNDVDEQDEDGNTVLHLAAQAGKMDVIKMAVHSGASLAVKNNAGETPTQLADERRKQHTPAGGIPVDQDQAWSHFNHACAKGNMCQVKILLCQSVGVNDTNRESWTPLHFAVTHGQFDIVSLLLDLHVDANARRQDGVTALHMGCECGHTDIVRLLLQNAANVNATDWKKRTPLHVASANCHADIVELLLQQNADVSITDLSGHTPLHKACAHDGVEIVQFLLKAGADVNKANYEGQTPLHVSCQNGNAPIVRLLVEHDAHVVIADEGNRTPLHLACENGSAIVVQLLLDQNAAVNTADKYGLTPLCVACDKGNLSCVQLLLNKDSTETIFSVDDLETALSYAQRHSHTHIATMIHARLLPARMSACSKTAPKQPSIRKKRLSKMFNKH